MNKITIALLFVFFYFNILNTNGISIHHDNGGLDVGVEYDGIGVWNNKTAIHIGLVGLVMSDEATLMMTIPNNLVYYDYLQPATAYNYLTKTLTIIGANYISNRYSIFTVDCQTWTLIKTVSVSQYSVLGGIQSLQSDDNSLMGFYTMLPTFYKGYVYKMLLTSEGYAYTVGGTQVTYRGSVFNPDTQIFYYAFQNTSGLYVQTYDINFIMQDEKEFTYVNTNSLYTPVNGPLAMSYDSNSKSIIVGVSVTFMNVASAAMATMDWNNGTFVIPPKLISPPYQNTVSITTIPYTTTAVALHYGDGDWYYLYLWNTQTNYPITNRPYKTPLMAIY